MGLIHKAYGRHQGACMHASIGLTAAEPTTPARPPQWASAWGLIEWQCIHKMLLTMLMTVIDDRQYCFIVPRMQINGQGIMLDVVTRYLFHDDACVKTSGH